jgi:hypothetical protein
LRSVGALYRALTPADRQLLAEEGAAAGDRARSGLAVGTSFGLRRRDADRANRRRIAESQLARLDAADVPAAIEDIVDMAVATSQGPKRSPEKFAVSPELLTQLSAGK